MYRPVPANKPHGLTAPGPLGGPEAGQVLCRAAVGIAQSSVPSALYAAAAAAAAAADLLPEAPGPVSRSVPPHTIWPVLPPLAACGVVAEWWQLGSMFGLRAGDECRDHSWPPTRAHRHYGSSSPLRPHKRWLTLFNFGRLCVFLPFCLCNVVIIYNKYRYIYI